MHLNRVSENLEKATNTHDWIQMVLYLYLYLYLSVTSEFRFLSDI
jgi:hypothetical protein